MSRTLLTSQPEMPPLNADAEPNIVVMFSTELVSQPERSALNAFAKLNIESIRVTKLTSQAEMSTLNDLVSTVGWGTTTDSRVMSANRPLMSATCDTSQSGCGWILDVSFLLGKQKVKGIKKKNYVPCQRSPPGRSSHRRWSSSSRPRAPR